jgi:hypothetical protein
VKCPICTLTCSPDAERCDCGYDFQVHAVLTTYLQSTDEPAEAPVTDRIANTVVAGVIHLGAASLGIWGMLAVYWARHPTHFAEDNASRALLFWFATLSTAQSTVGALLAFAPFLLESGERNRQLAICASLVSGAACAMAIFVASVSLTSEASFLRSALIGLASALCAVFVLKAIRDVRGV